MVESKSLHLCLYSATNNLLVSLSLFAYVYS